MTETQDLPTEMPAAKTYEDAGDADADVEPSHHARRPMNAFLIFCKRHRSVVRDKYPNLENRSITKILGEWWANLDSEDKTSYTALAKQYKDAFFNAHPDFKWYKLPAPPLRTFSTRPGNNTSNCTESETCSNGEIPESQAKPTNNNHIIKMNYNVASTSKLAMEPMFTPGKLADETQMGGLNSLLFKKEETNGEHVNGGIQCKINSANLVKPIHINELNNHNDSKMQKLQDELSKTSQIFNLSFNGNGGSNYSMKESNSPVYNNYYNYDDSKNFSRSLSDMENDSKMHLDSSDYIGKNINKDAWLNSFEKSHRSCKGKRYQEFMAVGGLVANKKPKKEIENKYAQSGRIYNLPACSWKPFENVCVKDESDRESNLDKSEIKSAYDDDTSQTTCKSTDQFKENSEITGNKAFKAPDFDLDAKIKALPSLSLEKFQQKKKENKKRKKNLSLGKHRDKLKEANHCNRDYARKAEPLNDLNKRPETKTDAISTNERLRLAEEHKAAIGSSKRKPRKISITRLNVKPRGSFEKISQTTSILSRPDQNAHDLCGLATLAEVAAKLQN